jgi:hypothetical protein
MFEIYPKNDTWFTIYLGTRQLSHLKMICNFHLNESENEKAKEATRKLLFCLERFPKLKALHG